MRASHISRLALAAGILVSGACGSRDEPAVEAVPPAAPAAAFRVTSVDLGKSLNADKSIANSASDFRPGDTVFVSVATEGASPGAAVKARWTFQDGQLVDESTQTVAPTGASRTEFHVMKPGGWPVGKYKVEISVDGALAGSKEFEVKGS